MSEETPKQFLKRQHGRLHTQLDHEFDLIGFSVTSNPVVAGTRWTAEEDQILRAAYERKVEVVFTNALANGVRSILNP